MKLLIVIILIILCSCNNSKNTSCSKEKLHSESIRNIELNKDMNGNSLSLSDIKSDEFVKLWNEAESVGLMKFKPDFYVKVNLASGDIRNFRVNSKYIKENNDCCFEITDSTFFYRIFTMKATE